MLRTKGYLGYEESIRQNTDDTNNIDMVVFNLKNY